MKTNKFLMTIMLLSSPVLLMAQDVMGTPWVNDKILLYSFYVIIAILLLVLLILYKVMTHMRNYLSGAFEKEEELVEEKVNRFRGIERFLQLRPISSDKDTMLADHNYDGIQELDNPPPPWFMFLFYGTIVFAIIYLAGFTFTGKWPTQEEEYIAKVEQLEAAKAEALAAQEAGIDENSVAATTEPADIASGQGIYVSKCQVCHLEDGKGMTGPNLTDEYWIHGGSDAEIFKTIKYGVVEKGMIAWQDQLTPKMMQDLVSYIRSLKYIGPDNGGKEPQGEKYTAAVPQEEAVESTDSTDSTEDAADGVTPVTEIPESGE